MKTKGKGALAFIFAVIFLDLLGVNLIVPVQAFLVRQYDTDALTVSLWSLGISRLMRIRSGWGATSARSARMS